MRRLLIFTVLICFAVSGSLTLFSAAAKAAEPGQSPATAPGIEQKQTDKEKETACSCCQKCMAAKKPVIPDKEKRLPETNGCKDCCSRCGNVKLPPHESIPPEVIKKK